MFTGNSAFLWGQILLFAAILLIFYGASELIAIRAETIRRLKGKASEKISAAGNNIGLSLDDGVLKRFEKHLTPDSEEKLNSLRRLLIRAGYRQPSAVRMFYAFRLILSLGMLLISVIFLPLFMTGTSVYLTVLTLLLMMMIAFYIPGFWVERTYQYRTLHISESFPDALDLLLVCIEAGHGFDQALNRVVREIQTSNPVLADELLVITRELRAGKERSKVLGDFAERTGVDDISSFITVIKQADKFGVSIAEALRVYSNEMRDKRYMRAEEKANMMPVKLALGAIAFTVPPAILVMVGPSVIMIIRHLGKLGH